MALLRNGCSVSCRTHQRQLLTFGLKLDYSQSTPCNSYHSCFPLFSHSSSLLPDISHPSYLENTTLHCKTATRQPIDDVNFTIKKNITKEDFDVKKFLFLSPPADISCSFLSSLSFLLLFDFVLQNYSLEVDEAVCRTTLIRRAQEMCVREGDMGPEP